MSDLGNAETNIKDKLTNLVTGYTIYTDILPEGYASPYIVLAGNYNNTSLSIQNGKKIRITFDLLIGGDYNQSNRSTVKEKLRLDIEKIFESSIEIVDNSINIFEDFNKNINTYGCIFTIII